MKSVAHVVLTLTLLIGLAVSSIPAAPASATPAKSNVLTIGEFAVAVAKSMDYAPETRATMSPEAALAALKESGWSFSGDAGAVLSQGELAAFLRQAGLQIRVSSPDQPVSADQAKTAVSGFGSFLASKVAPPAVVPPTSRTTSHAPTPEAFADCAALPKVPECRACCVNMGMSLQACGKACGRAHAALQVSASEPTP